jgi:hypothetical protein
MSVINYLCLNTIMTATLFLQPPLSGYKKKTMKYYFVFELFIGNVLSFVLQSRVEFISYNFISYLFVALALLIQHRLLDIANTIISATSTISLTR